MYVLVRYAVNSEGTIVYSSEAYGPFATMDGAFNKQFELQQQRRRPFDIIKLEQ